MCTEKYRYEPITAYVYKGGGGTLLSGQLLNKTRTLRALQWRQPFPFGPSVRVRRLLAGGGDASVVGEPCCCNCNCNCNCPSSPGDEAEDWLKAWPLLPGVPAVVYSMVVSV